MRANNTLKLKNVQFFGRLFREKRETPNGAACNREDLHIVDSNGWQTLKKLVTYKCVHMIILRRPIYWLFQFWFHVRVTWKVWLRCRSVELQLNTCSLCPSQWRICFYFFLSQQSPLAASNNQVRRRKINQRLQHRRRYETSGVTTLRTRARGWTVWGATCPTNRTLVNLPRDSRRTVSDGAARGAFMELNIYSLAGLYVRSRAVFDIVYFILNTGTVTSCAWTWNQDKAICWWKPYDCLMTARHGQPTQVIFKKLDY